MQVDHAATRSQGGLGIGLTLVRNLVEMHGGTVEARSAGLGKGSEFVVRLPLSVGDRDPSTEQDHGKRQEAAPASGPPTPGGGRQPGRRRQPGHAAALAATRSGSPTTAPPPWRWPGDYRPDAGVPGHRHAGHGRLRGGPAAAAAARPGGKSCWRR